MEKDVVQFIEMIVRSPISSNIHQHAVKLKNYNWAFYEVILSVKPPAQKSELRITLRKYVACLTKSD
jgi:hypothetical protein